MRQIQPNLVKGRQTVLQSNFISIPASSWHFLKMTFYSSEPMFICRCSTSNTKNESFLYIHMSITRNRDVKLFYRHKKDKVFKNFSLFILFMYCLLYANDEWDDRNGIFFFRECFWIISLEQRFGRLFKSSWEISF